MFSDLSRYDRQHSQNIRIDGRVAGSVIAIPLEGLGQIARGVTFTGVARELPTCGVDSEVASFVVRWPAAEAALNLESLARGEIPTRLYEVIVTEWILFDEENFPEQPRRIISTEPDPSLTRPPIMDAPPINPYDHDKTKDVQDAAGGRHSGEDKGSGENQGGEDDK